MPRFSVSKFLVLAVVLCVSAPAYAEEASFYDRLMSGKTVPTAVKNLALFIFVTPTQREVVDASLKPVWWANHPGLEMGDAEKKRAMGLYKTQFDALGKAVGKYKIRSMKLAGFTQIGTMRNLDLYYAADSAKGPIIFRVSVSFDKNPKPWLHEVKVYEGFKPAREAIAQIQHLPTTRVASFNANPKKKDDGADKPKPGVN